MPAIHNKIEENLSLKQQSGRKAKKEGHAFEHVVADKLTKDFGKLFEVEGASNTKIDVRDVDSNVRLSVKNPLGKNTQIGLYTQKSFIDMLNITDQDIITFIGMFFGGEKYSDYNRHHRMKKSDIDPALNQKFTDFLNNNTGKILDLLATHGHNQIGDVNYLVWASEKNNPNSLILIDLKEFKKELSKGKWSQNETTFEFNVNGKKLFHLQMKGSGTRYTNGYHSLMFHIHNNFDTKYVKDFKVLQGLL